MSLGITVRQALPNDAPQLLEIYTPYVLETAVTFEYVPPSVDEFEGRIREALSKYTYLVSELDGKIAGYAYAGVFKSRAAYARSVETSVYVRSEFKRCGVGRALYAELERRLAERGILNLNACIAYTQNPDDRYLRADSVRFHESVGFTKAAHFHKCAYKFGQWYDMIWMEKLIGEHLS